MAVDKQQGTIYNALTGLELRKKILHDVEVMLDNDDRFRNHQTYPRVEFSFKLSLKVYPGAVEEFALETEKGYGEVSLVEAGQEPQTIEIDGKSEHKNPDRIRKELDMPVPRPQKTKTGIVELTKEQAERQADNRPTHTVEIEPAGTDPEAAQQGDPALASVVVSGYGGEARVERTEIPGHAVARPLIIPREPANPKVSISNEAAADGEFGRPVEIDITPRHGNDRE